MGDAIPRVEIEDVSDGQIYTANGKSVGPFSPEQIRLDPQLDLRIAQELEVPVKAVLAARLHQRMFTAEGEDAPPIIEIHGEQFDEHSKPHVIARAVLAEKSILTVAENGEMYDYDKRKGFYRVGAKPRIEKGLEYTFRKLEIEKRLTSNVVREALEHVKRRSYIGQDQLNKDLFLLNVKNGMLDLRTFALLPHDPKYLSTVQLQVNYDPEAKCPASMKFFEEVLYKEDIPAIQELLGYLLWKDYPAAIAWMLVGTGGNGKSTFIALVGAMLGIENLSSRGLIELERNRFATAELYGKLANLYADLEDVALRTTGKFKMLTGRDPVTAEFKYKKGFPFVNYAKLIFSCNKIPEAIDDTDAFFRRWVIVTFPNQFLGDREDRELLSKLTTSEEQSGLLNFALEGLKRLRLNNWHFTNPKTTTQIRQEYIRKSSPIQAFLTDCCTEDVDDLTPKTDLYAKFSEYCHLNKLPVPGPDTFFKRLPEIKPNFAKFYGSIPNGPVKADGKPKRVHCIKGLTVLPKERWGRIEEDEGDEGENNSESPAHVAHPEPQRTPDAHLTPPASTSVHPVQGVQSSTNCNAIEPLDPLGTHEERQAATGFLTKWCKELPLPHCAQELVSAGYTRDLALAERFVKELTEHGLLGGP
jgi:P4 family phage/plasmid primase-like protien